MLVVVGFMIGIIAMIVLFFMLTTGNESSVTPIEKPEEEANQKVDRDSIEGTQLEEEALNLSLDTDTGISLTVRNKIRPFVPGGEYGLIVPDDQDNEFVAVDIEIANNGDLKLDQVATRDFKLVDSEGLEYSQSFVIDESEMWSIGFEPFTLEDFDPGDEADGYILFEVPKSATDLKLIYILEESYLFGDEDNIDERYEIEIE